MASLDSVLNFSGYCEIHEHCVPAHGDSILTYGGASEWAAEIGLEFGQP